MGKGDCFVCGRERCPFSAQPAGGVTKAAGRLGVRARRVHGIQFKIGSGGFCYAAGPAFIDARYTALPKKPSYLPV